ncbi:mevalonate kinase-like [Camponotus floridanus]|uniref:mevalonate kinase-like n=1 Tax=Camponotus floridanus TaxID=104421 RepID=UPI000DC6CA36|nr:mevalonate kinase-like [Camponotus floridanus]
MDDAKKLKKIEFKVSAPGRIILSGEPSMMYGGNVVSASIDLRTTLKFCEITDNRKNIIEIDFPDIDLYLNLSLEHVLNFFLYNNNNNANLFIEEYIMLLIHVQYFITVNGMWSTYEQRFSLQTFFFLFIYTILNEELSAKSFHVCLTSQLPMRAGLGSSTSFATCLAACFLHWARLQEGIDEFSDEDLEQISDRVWYCEEILQNYVSNIDNEVCSYGKIIRFRHGNRTDPNFKRFLNVSKIKILLIDSRIRQNKFEQVKRLAEMKFSNSTILNMILNNINYISEEVSNTLTNIDYIQKINFPTKQLELQNAYETLKHFVLLHQLYFCFLKLSHPNIDMICDIVKEYGFAGKITNFGGRYVCILLPPDAIDEDVMMLSAHLMSLGYYATKTSMSCSGVRIDNSY